MTAGTGAGVKLAGVSKFYSGAAAVDDVTLAVEAGEFLTLLGPSGSGKTTTLMMLAGFETPSQGQVWIGDECVTFLPPYHRNLGFVFQNYALFPHLTIFQNLAFPLEMRGVDTADIGKHVSASLDMVRLAGLEKRYPSQLSGGQQQRVAVARALIFRPPVLLMDEPLGALDKKLRQQMQLEIKRIHDELGITFIYVTHDQEEALTMSDRIAIMNAGKIVQVNSPREIYEKPANEFVAGFVGETNLLTGTVQRAADGQRMVSLGEQLSIPIPSDAAAEPGSNASVVVRPERVQITPVSKDSPFVANEAGTCLRGEVTECVYVGEQWRYKVRAGQLSISAKRMCGRDTPTLPIGSAVEVAWRVDDSQVL